MAITIQPSSPYLLEGPGAQIKVVLISAAPALIACIVVRIVTGACVCDLDDDAGFRVIADAVVALKLLSIIVSERFRVALDF